MAVLTSEILDILSHEAPVAIVTAGPSGPHLVGTWQSYIQVDGDSLIIPAGGYRATQANVESGSPLQLLVGSRDVPGPNGYPGGGFRLTGTGSFIDAGPVFERTKARFPWCHAALVVHVSTAQRLI
ncbi:MAG: FMN-binding protein [Bacillota bacterium]